MAAEPKLHRIIVSLHKDKALLESETLSLKEKIKIQTTEIHQLSQTLKGSIRVIQQQVSHLETLLDRFIENHEGFDEERDLLNSIIKNFEDEPELKSAAVPN